MSSRPTFARDLPFPVARLWRQSRNAKSSTEGHNRAWFAWELSARLAVIGGNPTAMPALRVATVGDWVRVLPLSGKNLTQPEILALHAHLARVADPHAGLRSSIGRREFLDALVAYRNRVIGHGPSRDEAFCREGARLLRDALVAAWEADLFLPADARLVFVEAVEILSGGQHVARVLDLGLETPTILESEATPVPASVEPHRVFLRGADGWTDLSPWLVFDGESAAFYVFQALKRRPDYIDYSSGAGLDRDELARLAPTAEEEIQATFRGVAPADDPARPAAPSARRFGEYEILGEIGRGGMGVVYLANQVRLSRLVALKTLPEQSRADPVLRARFHREIEALARCDHPNVVKIHASGEEDGVPYFAMEYVSGTDLRRVGAGLTQTKSMERALGLAWQGVLAERGSLAEVLPSSSAPVLTDAESGGRYRAAAQLIRDAAQGVQALHDAGIIHRDLSPANILVTSGEARAVVMDLGLALLQDGNRSLSKDQSQILGTLRYMPPEQLQRNLLQVDRRADVYALGAVLYELLSDKPFFDGDTQERLIEQVLRESPVPMRKIDRAIPEDLAKIVQVATDKDARLRYESAGAMAQDLAAYLDGRPIQARAPTPGYLLRRWVGRNPALAASVVIGAVGVGTALGLFLLARRDARIEQVRMMVYYDEGLADKLIAAWRAMPASEPSLRNLEILSLYVEDLGLRVEQYASLAQDEEPVQATIRARSSVLAEDPPVDDENAEASSFGAAIEEQINADVKRKRESVLASWIAMSDPKGGLLRCIELDKQRMRTLIDDRPEIDASWAPCIASIAASPRYGGLRIAPQRGLRPLRQDPASGLWEFWHVPSGARPALDAAGVPIPSEESGLVLVLVPGGAFDMGAQSGADAPTNRDPLAGPECSPVTRIELAPYFLSKYEMTQSQWARVHLVNPSHAQKPRVRDDESLRPVEKISWVEARQTMAKLGLVLPTEAQWEYACRGGTSTVWASGDTRADQQAWANLADEELRRRGGPSGWDYEPWNDGQRDTCAVGRYRANGFGLHDVHGNVMEWVAEDCFPEYELAPRPGDGLRTGPNWKHPEFNQIPHVARGGGWQTSAARSRSSHRYGVQEAVSFAIGIRPARPVETNL